MGKIIQSFLPVLQKNDPLENSEIKRHTLFIIKLFLKSNESRQTLHQYIFLENSELHQ